MNALRSARPKLTGAYSSPARATLALAIGELAAHDEKVARLSSALPGLAGRRSAAWTAKDEAEAAVATAAAVHAAHVLAEASGDAVEGAEAPPSPQEAARRLKHAKDDVETAGAAYELCEQQIREASDNRPQLENAVKRGASAVLREALEMNGVVKRLERASVELASLAADYIWLADHNVLENKDPWGSTINTPEATAIAGRARHLAAMPWANLVGEDALKRMTSANWKANLAELMVDANAPLADAVGI